MKYSMMLFKHFLNVEYRYVNFFINWLLSTIREFIRGIAIEINFEKLISDRKKSTDYYHNIFYILLDDIALFT